jgi:hypothetical protein
MARIEEWAFSESGLRSIEILASVTFIDGSAFAGISVSSISVSPDNMQFCLSECFLEGFDRSMIYRYFGSCRSIVIPSSVVVLGKSSFRRCKSLESVRFESGSRLEQIEEWAFSESGLRSIEVPSPVLALGKASFRWCKSLRSMTFESGSRLERIEELALSESGLKSIDILASVTLIDGSAFSGVYLNSIWVSPDNKRFCLRECFLEDSDGSMICRYFGS